MAKKIEVISDDKMNCVFAIYCDSGFTVYKLSKIQNDDVFKYNIFKISKYLNTNLSLIQIKPLGYNMVVTVSKEQKLDEITNKSST